MTFPRLNIDLERLYQNAMREQKLFAQHGIELMGVNKVFSGLLPPAQILQRAGYKAIAESRLYCLKQLQNLTIDKCLLRTPSLSEMDQCAQWADISLHGQIESVRALSLSCLRIGRRHRIMFMVDMGDLREGLWFENYAEIRQSLDELLQLPFIDLYGLGTNFNCFGAIRPSVKNGTDFVLLARRLEHDLQIKINYISGGNCTSFSLFEQGLLPEGINHLRIGGLHLFGIDYVNFKYVPGFHHSSMDIKRVCSPLYKLQAEIIEIGVKPTMPVGENGLNAFLESKTFVDRGIRKRAILNLGRLDIAGGNLWPVDDGIEILGQSSDHTIVDIHNSKSRYELGDTVEFEIDYTGLLFASQAPGIQKLFTPIDFKCQQNL